MRICTEIKTGKLIEMQSDASEGTLLQNAINAGYAAEDVLEQEITPADWDLIRAGFPQPVHDPVVTQSQLAAALELLK